ncbi:MAG: hypothetical protein ACPKMZ_00545 [Pleomorphochaeta sp.]
MKRKLIILFAVISLFTINSVFATDTFYQKGDQKVTFNVGPSIPAFIYFFTTTDSTHTENFYPGLEVLDVGGYGSINFDFFISEKESLGIEVGYDFNYDKGDEIYSNVPIAALYTYTPIQNGVWDFSLSAGLGISFNSRDDQTLLSLFSSFKANGSYFFNENWGIGLSSGLYLAPNINYLSDLTDDNGIIAYAPVTLSLTFRN